MKWNLKPIYLLVILFALLQSACSHFPGTRIDTASELKLSAEKGDPKAQLLLAHLLDEGAGIPRDPDAAMEWYRRSADLGDPDACFELAGLQLSGKIAPHDDKNIVRLLFKSAKAGNTGAQSLLGALFVAGRGKDAFVTQVKLARKGAEKGDSDGQYNLGWMLREGAGLPRGTPDAQFWLKKAAKQGNAPAALLLGDMALGGEAARKDSSAAMLWYEKASAGGDPLAIDRLYRLQGKGIKGAKPMPVPPRQRPEFEDGYRRLQLEFAEEQSAKNPESAQVAVRRLLALDPADREARNISERLPDKGNSQLVSLFSKADQQIAAAEFRSYAQTLAKIISLNPDEIRLRELNARYWVRFERVTAAMEKKREELKEEKADSGESVFKKGISLLEGGQFDEAARLFEKLARTPGYNDVAGAYVYLGITSLARINMSKVKEAKKLRLKGIASFQNALRFDRKAALPAAYGQYRDIFDEAVSSLK